jgi:hypothetical protein
MTSCAALKRRSPSGWLCSKVSPSKPSNGRV